MNTENLYYFIEGVCLTFFVIMAMQNLLHRDNRLRSILGVILAYWACQHLLSVVFIDDLVSGGRNCSRLINALDMTAEPTCFFLLMELCRPGWLSWRKVAWNESLFVIPGVISVFYDALWLYYLLIGIFVAYGVGVFVATLVNMRRYNRFLNEHYSYKDNVTLSWLYGVIFTFFILMFLYAICSAYDTIWGDMIYLIGSVVGWSMICYFISKQESVLLEMVVLPKRNIKQLNCADSEEENGLGIDFAALIEKNFLEPRRYLEPYLKLSDMAQMVGTNRTYLSQYLNDVLKMKFYDYVNGLRLEYALEMMKEGQYPITVISTMSGFNSYSTFRRVFISRYGVAPSQYLAQVERVDIKQKN